MEYRLKIVDIDEAEPGDLVLIENTICLTGEDHFGLGYSPCYISINRKDKPYDRIPCPPTKHRLLQWLRNLL